MNQELIPAIEAIKIAILQSQYQAAKETTRVQLILYYGIGRYLSSKKGKKNWGTSVLETISSQLRKELPGLRGFSATSLKKMRLFYENWSFLEDSDGDVPKVSFLSFSGLTRKSKCIYCNHLEIVVSSTTMTFRTY